jgi:hypothetical protein
MSPASLAGLRAVEELRGLERVWQLLEVTHGGLTGNRYRSLHDTYCHHHEDLAALAEHSPEADSQDFVGAVKEAGEFEREILSYIAGNLLRASSLGVGDEGVGATADQLLAELAARTRIEIPPIIGLEFGLGSESLSPLIELIRIRFPGSGFWDLPVLAHEFGHYIMGKTPAVPTSGIWKLREVRDRLTRDQQDGLAPWHRTSDDHDDESLCRHRAEELVADVFATYALGPAYPQCSIALRVLPTELDRLDSKHPPWRHRVTAMIDTLRTMYRLSPSSDFLDVVTPEVRELWESVASRSGPALRSDQKETLQQWADEITHELQHVSGLMYVGADPFNLLAFRLANGADADEPPSGSTVTDVLNAAWRWRLDGNRRVDAVNRIAARSLAYCRHFRKET